MTQALNLSTKLAGSRTKFDKIHTHNNKRLFALMTNQEKQETEIQFHVF